MGSYFFATGKRYKNLFLYKSCILTLKIVYYSKKFCKKNFMREDKYVYTYYALHSLNKDLIFDFQKLYLHKSDCLLVVDGWFFCAFIFLN